MKSATFLTEELKTRLKKGLVKFRLVVQRPNPGDPTNDPSLVWPEDRRTIEVGMISVTSVVDDSDAAQKALAVAPTNLTDGIELSDDPVPALRTGVYTLTLARRQRQCFPARVRKRSPRRVRTLRRECPPDVTSRSIDLAHSGPNRTDA
jgi:catalase